MNRTCFNLLCLRTHDAGQIFSFLYEGVSLFFILWSYVILGCLHKWNKKVIGILTITCTFLMNTTKLQQYDVYVHVHFFGVSLKIFYGWSSKSARKVFWFICILDIIRHYNLKFSLSIWVIINSLSSYA